MSSMLIGLSTNSSMSMYIQDEDKSPLYSPRYYWSYQRRGKRQPLTEDNQYFSLWPSARMCQGDPSVAGVIGADIHDGTPWGWAFEQTECGEDGYYRPYYLRGQTVDVNGNIIVGATVYVFITATHTLNGVSLGVAGTSIGTSDVYGNYQIPCNSTANHYAVAYYPGSPDIAGTTVSTLTPTL